MPKAEKIERVGELKDRIEGSQALLLTEYRGLTVSDITELRRSLAEGGTGFAVVKNTLMQRAAVEAAIDELESLLEGPTAVAFVAGDPVAAAKKVVDAAKKFPTLVLKGGYMDGRVLSADEAKALAELESREVMLSKVAGMLKSEMARAAAMFVSAQSKFLSLLDAYRDKMPAEEVPAPDAAAPSDDSPDLSVGSAEASAGAGDDGGSESDSAAASGADAEAMATGSTEDEQETDDEQGEE
jgi:large subunit ribosomal protein L10